MKFWKRKEEKKGTPITDFTAKVVLTKTHEELAALYPEAVKMAGENPYTGAFLARVMGNQSTRIELETTKERILSLEHRVEDLESHTCKPT